MLLGAAVLAAPARADDGENDLGPVPWRLGGRLGLTVDIAAFPDSTAYALEVYTRIPPGTLAALEQDDGGATRLRLTVRLRNSYGAKMHEVAQEFGVDPGDSTAGFGKVVVVRFQTRPGPQRLLVKLEDLNKRKRSIVHIGRKVNESSQIDGDFTVPPPQAGSDISDIEFVWSERAAEGRTAFTRGERHVVPNPERLYGLFQTDLHAKFVARGDGERPWSWIARVLDAKGHLVAQQESTAVASRWLMAGTTIDLTQQPAGGYDLEVKAWQEGDAGALLRRAHFSVAWQREAWQRNPRDIQDAVHFLLSAEEEEGFARLHPGEQERYMEDFWRERDPSPETAENEARETFLERVRYADQNFSRAGNMKGSYSDMGRVYIRYGEPDEVYRQVLPAGDETLKQVVASLSLTEDRPVGGDVTQPGPGGDLRAWEVWIYEGDIGLPPDTDPKAVANRQRKRRIVFLFVDEQGLGDMRQRYSTE